MTTETSMPDTNKNSYIPRLRFAGHTEEFSKRKPKELSSIKTGKLDANAMIPNGKYDFYTSGITKYKIDKAAFVGPAITIAGNGASVGYMHFADGKFNAYQRIYVLDNFSANRKYLFYETGKSLPNKIHYEISAGNIPYIVLDILSELTVYIPSIEEQQKTELISPPSTISSPFTSVNSTSSSGSSSRCFKNCFVHQTNSQNAQNKAF